MRTALLALFFIAIFYRNAGAQITFTASSFPGTHIGTDTIKITTYNSLFPSLAPATTATWDMTVITDSTPVFFAFRLPVATYQYADSNHYRIGAYGYHGNAPSSVISTGLCEYGIYTKYTAYSLSSITTGPFDTFYIPAQNSMYTSPLVKIAFPCTYNSSWQSVYHNDIAFELSVSLLSYLHTPGFVRTYSERRDTVTGWGKMRVRNAAGAPSDYFDVLQVQSTTITVDSFFLNGAPAPGVTLTMLSLTQGKRDTTFIQHFYRAQEVTPMATVEYKDAAFTQPFKASTHMQRLAQPVGLQYVENTAAFSVYPNPSLSRNLFVRLEAPDGDLTYTLCDVTGRILQQGVLQPVNGEYRLMVPDQLATGVYYLTLERNGDPIGTSAITISQ